MNFEGTTEQDHVKTSIPEFNTFSNVLKEEDVPTVPWFPRTLDDLDKSNHK